MFDINSVIETAKQVITRPREFFEQMPKHGGYIEPLIFVAVIGVVSGLIGAIFSIVSGGHMGGIAFGFGSIISMPIAVIIGSFIFSGVLFAVWKLMASPEDYETAFRCVAYAVAILPVATVLALVPYLGTLAANLWWFWLMFLASTLVHNLEQQKSLIVIGVIAVVVMFFNLSGERTSREMFSRMSEFHDQMSEIQSLSPD